MTKKQAIDSFLENKPFGDYWEMQLAWACYIDGLNRDGEITDRQRNTWDNPCTPKTFKRFNRKFKGGYKYEGCI